MTYLPDNHQAPYEPKSEHTEFERDRAEDQLQLFTRCLEHIAMPIKWLADGFKDVPQQEMRALIQEAVQEAFHKRHRELTTISGSTAQIPDFLEPTPKLATNAREIIMALHDKTIAALDICGTYNGSITGGSHA